MEQVSRNPYALIGNQSAILFGIQIAGAGAGADGIVAGLFTRLCVGDQHRARFHPVGSADSLWHDVLGV